MKKIILAALLLAPALGIYAQEQQTHSIQVSGAAKIDREVEAYLIDFAIAADYGESESKKPFEDLKKSIFAKALSSISQVHGLSSNLLREMKNISRPHSQ